MTKLNETVAGQVERRERWTDQCRVCHGLAWRLENELTLMRPLSEEQLPAVVKSMCERMVILVHYSSRWTTYILFLLLLLLLLLLLDQPIQDQPDLLLICHDLTSGSLLLTLAWLAWLHSDKIRHQVRVERLFADFACEELAFCSRWEGEEAARQKEAFRNMEEVFF
jgi:hypothetical protein